MGINPADYDFSTKKVQPFKCLRAVKANRPRRKSFKSKISQLNS